MQKIFLACIVCSVCVSNAASQSVREAIVSSTEQEYVPETCMRLFDEVDALYRLGEQAFSRGETATAYECYSRASERLNRITANPEVHAMLTEDFTTSMDRLNAIIARWQQEHARITAVSQPGKSSLSRGTTFYISIPVEDPVVQQYIRTFTRSGAKQVFNDALTRYCQYSGLVLQILDEYNIPEDLAYLPLVESLYDVNDCSRSKALGLWQFIPSTAQHCGFKMNYWVDERKDPEKSTYIAAEFLTSLHKVFDNWELVLAAYNHGPNAIQKELAASRSGSYTALQRKNMMSRETDHFVPKFVAFKWLADHYKEYGFTPDFSAPQYEYDTVALDFALDISLAATGAGITETELRWLNPSLLKWCTPPTGFVLKIPKGTKDAFLNALPALKEKQAALDATRPKRDASGVEKKSKSKSKSKSSKKKEGVTRYTVQKGDTLSGVAKKFHTTVDQLRSDNKPKNDTLSVGKILKIKK